jgi:hypothetical protein
MARHVRDLRLERFWRDHVKQQQTSGQSIRGYCQRHSLKEPAFYAWRRIIAARDAASTPATPTAKSTAAPKAKPAFLPVKLVDRPPMTSTSASSPYPSGEPRVRGPTLKVRLLFGFAVQ